MKKAQIINKILNKILINTASLYNIFSILAIKKEKPRASLFLSATNNLFCRHICRCSYFFCSFFLIFAAYITFCHFHGVVII